MAITTDVHWEYARFLAGVEPSPPGMTLSVRVPVEQVKRLLEVADGRGLTLVEMLRSMVDEVTG